MAYLDGEVIQNKNKEEQDYDDALRKLEEIKGKWHYSNGMSEIKK